LAKNETGYYHFKFQVADVEKSERPEYEEIATNRAWRTILEEATAEGLLCAISDWLNDENGVTDVWTRIVKDKICLQSGLITERG